MRLSAIFLLFSLVVAVSYAAPAVEKEVEEVKLSSVEVEQTTVAGLVEAEAEDEAVTVVPEEGVTAVPAQRDGRQVDDDDDEDAEDDGEEADEEEDDDEEEEEEEEEEEAAVSRKNVKNKNKKVTAQESKPVPVMADGNVEDDEAEDLGISGGRQEGTSDEKASDEKDSEEANEDEPKDNEESDEEEEEEDDPEDSNAGEKSKKKKGDKKNEKNKKKNKDEPEQKPQGIRPFYPLLPPNDVLLQAYPPEDDEVPAGPSTSTQHIVGPSVATPPVLEEVGYDKVEQQQDTPILGETTLNKLFKPAIVKATGALEKYQLIPKMKATAKRKNAGLIDVNGQKKVFVEYDDGSIRIVEDDPKMLVAQMQSDQKKNQSVFHEIADVFLDLVGTRDELFFQEEDDAVVEDDPKKKEADESEESSEDEEEDDDGSSEAEAAEKEEAPLQPAQKKPAPKKSPQRFEKTAVKKAKQNQRREASDELSAEELTYAERFERLMAPDRDAEEAMGGRHEEIFMVDHDDDPFVESPIISNSDPLHYKFADLIEDW